MKLWGAFRALTCLYCVAVSFTLGSASASAKGTVTVRQADGDVDVYNNVSIKVLHGALYLTTEDGKGTLVIHRAACSYQGQLLVCFATSSVLTQGGTTKAVDLRTGTIYLNSTDQPQPLVLSTAKVRPHNVLMSLSTYAGTYIGLDGRIDQVVK